MNAPNPDDLVVIHTFSDPNTAEIVANALRDENIQCDVDGEHQAGFTGTGALEINLVIRAADRKRAEKILESHEPL